MIYNSKSIEEKKMPRYLDNYKLEIMENINYDNSNYFVIKVEYYFAKENDTYQNFILKRFKINPSPTSTQTKSLNLSPREQELFNRLNNETLILKILEHKSIPKCLRILKTSNSVYFVFQEYPLNTIENYVHKNIVSLDEKISLTIKIISTVLYIHSKNVVYKAMNLENIHINESGDIFFTNFKNSIYFENLQSTQKSLEIIKKEREFLVLLKQDIINLAKMLYELFEFNKIDPKVYSFKNKIEKKLYEHLSEILRKIISPNILETLLKILREKETIRTTANTDEPESPRSPCLSGIKAKKVHIRNNTSIESELKSFRNSGSGFNLPLKDSLSSRVTLLQSQKIFPKESLTTLNSSRSKLSSSTRFVSSKTYVQLTERPSVQSITASREIEALNKEKEQKRKETLESITKNRKILQFVLNCLKQINFKKSTNLIILFLIKCEELTKKITENILFIKSEPLTIKKEKEFINIVDSEILSTGKFLTFIKESLLELINLESNDEKLSYKSIREYCLKNRLFSLEDNLTAEIYAFIDKEMKILIRESIETTSSENFKNKSKSLNSVKVDAEKESTIKSSKNLSFLKSITEYEKYKWLYFMSIKLKYSNFEKFYDKKVSSKSSQLDIFKEDYFLPFESQSIPIDQIIDEIVLRLDRYGKKCSPSVISVK